MSEYRDDFREVEREAYWSFPRIFFGAVIVGLAIALLSFIATGGDLAIYRFWAPKVENAKREVFENTQSYVQGKVEYLSQLRFQYQNAAPGSAQQASLRSLILSEASTVDNSKLPVDLQTFVGQMKVAF